MASQKVLDQLEAWRRDLVNLNRTNRLLYFRHTKTSTVGLAGRTPDQLLSELETPARRGWGLEVPEGDRTYPTRPDHVLTDKADIRLQENALRTLERKATQEYLDKGLWILYVALGMLVWQDPQDTREARSPLVLVPVSLSRDTPRDSYRLTRAEEDLDVNRALEIKLRTDFEIRLPGLDVLEAGSLETYFSEVEAATEGLGGRVERSAVLAPFSFHKEVMYRDLLDNAEQIAEHPIVAALADPRGGTVESLDFDPVADERLDAEAPPEEMASVLPADSSQRRCIVAARNSRSFVMDGPPGTGKSQTITNMIAELLRDGRTVLFVSEKAAALEVVRNRLEDAGLGEFALELHSHKATRKEVAQELGRSLSRRVLPGAELSAIDRRAALKHREQLSGYAEAMNSPRDETGRSLHETLGRLTQLKEFPSATRPHAAVRDVSAEDLAELLELAGTLARAWGPVELGDEFLWRGVTGRRPRSTLLNELLAALHGLNELEVLVARQTRLPRPATLASMARQRPLLEHLAEPPRIPAAWITGEDLTAVQVALQGLAAAQAEHAALGRALRGLVGDRYREVEPKRQHHFYQAAARLGRLGWNRWQQHDAAAARGVARALRRAAKALPELQRRSEDVTTGLGLPLGGLTITRAEHVAELGELAGAQHRPEPEWLSPLVQDTLERAANVLGELVQEYRAQEAALADVFAPEVLQLDLPELERRFQNVHRGLRKWGSAYRADKRTLAAVTQTGKANKKVRARLGEAREWRSLSQRLDEAEGQHADVLGPSYYRRTATDFGAVVAAVEVARRAVQLVGREAQTAGVLEQLSQGHRPDSFLPQDAQQLRGDLARWKLALQRAMGQVPPDLPLSDVRDWCLRAAKQVDILAELGEHVSGVAGRSVPLTQVRDVLEQRQALADFEDAHAPDNREMQELLGEAYQGLRTDLDSLEDDLAWTVRLRQLLGGPVLERTAAAVLSARPDVPALDAAWQRWEKLREELLGLFASPRAAELRGELDGNEQDVAELVTELGRTTPDIDEWQTYSQTKLELAERGLQDTIDDLVSARTPSSTLQGAVEKAILEAHVDVLFDTDDRLATYRSADRDHLVQNFQALDRRLLESGAASVITSVNSRRPRTATGVAGIIQREAQKKTKHMPVRRLLAETADVTQRLKPCFMMSPLTVSQFLTGEVSFDVVIFDEASQVLPADAVNCIYRAQQVVVAGDQKQMPPTSFFMGTTADDGDDYDEAQLDEFESVLDLCKGSGGFPSLPLLWHYRSQHESLITYSNYSFYQGQLVTFPGALQDGDDVGIALLQVPDGTYRRGGPRDNPREATMVVDRVLEHARRHPELTCGVVSFSEAQAAAIEFELERRRKDAPELDGYFASGRLDGFFVKNLENVQGDERDIIIFSVGYGPDENRKMTMNFGPINRGGGWRRLNVAATRARRRVEVVSSITSGDIHGTVNESVLHLKRYLDFAERGLPALSLELEESQGGADSPFEEDVAAVLRSWGYDVVPQVGSAGYRIDMAVRDPRRPGAFALGIECDGAMYHSSKVARDRDRLREEVLKGLGWRLHRIWGTAWYRDRSREEERLHAAVRDAVEAREKPTADTTEPARRAGVAVEDVAMDERPVWAETYHAARVATRLRGDVTDPHTQPEIARIIREVLAQEGPVHQDRLLRRIRIAFGVGRSGAKVRAAVDAALARCVRERVAEVGGDFVAAPGQWHVAVRVPDEADDETRRKIEEVPDAELAMALRLHVADAHAIDREALLVAVARLFGWGRIGPDIRLRLEDALDQALDNGQLTESAGRIRLV